MMGMQAGRAGTGTRPSAGGVAWCLLVAGVVSCAPGVPRAVSQEARTTTTPARTTTTPARPMARRPVGAGAASAKADAGLRGGERVRGNGTRGGRAGAAGAWAHATRTTGATAPPGDDDERLAFVRMLLAVPRGEEAHPCRVGSRVECEPLLVPMHVNPCGIGTSAQHAAAAGLWRFGLACRRFGVGCAQIENLCAFMGVGRWVLIPEIFGPAAPRADSAR